LAIDSPPPPAAPRVPPAANHPNSGQLFWIRKDLVVQKSFTPADCFQVRGSDRVEKLPVKISFREIWSHRLAKESMPRCLSDPWRKTAVLFGNRSRFAHLHRAHRDLLSRIRQGFLHHNPSARDGRSRGSVSREVFHRLTLHHPDSNNRLILHHPSSNNRLGNNRFSSNKDSLGNSNLFIREVDKVPRILRFCHSSLIQGTKR
jgi:hypothetical protein